MKEIKEIKEQSVGNIVAENIETAKFFEKLGIDYCCNGNQTLEEACRRLGLDIDKVIDELSNLTESKSMNRFGEWDVSFLIDYIINNHHEYIKAEIPLIENQLEKVINEHAEQHPEVSEVARLFSVLKEEVLQHLSKEEKMLFPYIKKLYIADKNHLEMPIAPFGSIKNPIRVMRNEHENARKLLSRLYHVTNGFKLPENACNTFRILYNHLMDFYRDLHIHTHLENNTLFPKAEKLENQQNKTQSNL